MGLIHVVWQAHRTERHKVPISDKFLKYTIFLFFEDPISIILTKKDILLVNIFWLQLQ